MTTSHQQEQDERRRLLGSTNLATTYRDLAARDLNLESGGRYAQPTHVVGSSPVPQYPSASGPWSGGDNAVEPPTGIDINFVEPCGTEIEIQQSISALAIETSVGEVSVIAASVTPIGGGDGKEPAPPTVATEVGTEGVPLPYPPLPASSFPTPSTSLVIKRRHGL